jgi:signal transduction histidine kinase
VVREALARVAVPDDPRVEVVCQLDETLPPISADPGQLGRVLDNLILNAIQAMPDGGQLVLASGLDVDALTGGPDWVSVSIADTGVGIPEDKRARVFGPLFTTKPKGIGLGLVVVKTLVEAHHGTVDVESQEDKGSVFTVRLPLG